MSKGIAVLVPVLGRPQNVKPLLESIAATTPAPYRVLFLADPGDRAEQDALALAGAWFLSPGGSYAKKIRVGVEATDEPYVVLAADDVVAHPGWLEAALAKVAEGAHAVGLNDLRPRGWETATHFLLTREYAERPTIDGGPGPLHHYTHNFCDRELIETAKRRGVYAYAADARFEHRHHLDGHAPLDTTYAKGQASFRQDARLFARRTRLWAG
jgi:glycosyltransferase involved in cell wall biosynthesis